MKHLLMPAPSVVTPQNQYFPANAQRMTVYTASSWDALGKTSPEDWEIILGSVLMHFFPGHNLCLHKTRDVQCARNIQARIKDMSLEICGHFDKRRPITNLVRFHNALIPILLTNRFAATFLLFAPAGYNKMLCNSCTYRVFIFGLWRQLSLFCRFSPLLWGPSATQTDLWDKRWHGKRVAGQKGGGGKKQGKD